MSEWHIEASVPVREGDPCLPPGQSEQSPLGSPPPCSQPRDQDHLGQSQEVPGSKSSSWEGRAEGYRGLKSGTEGSGVSSVLDTVLVLTGLPFLGTSFLVMTSRRPEQPQAHRPRLLPCTVGGLLTSGPAQSKRNGRCSGCRARGRPGGGCAQKALPSAAGLPLGLRLEGDLPWGSRPEGTQAVSPGHGHLHLSLPAAPLSCEPPKTRGLLDRHCDPRCLLELAEPS